MWMQNIRWPNQDRKVGFATYVEFKDNVTAHGFDWLDKNELDRGTHYHVDARFAISKHLKGPQGP